MVFALTRGPPPSIYRLVAPHTNHLALLSRPWLGLLLMKSILRLPMESSCFSMEVLLFPPRFAPMSLFALKTFPHVTAWCTVSLSITWVSSVPQPHPISGCFGSGLESMYLFCTIHIISNSSLVARKSCSHPQTPNQRFDPYL